MTVSSMSPYEQFKTQLKDLREIVKNFRMVGPGVSGSFKKGYQVRAPDIGTPEGGGMSGSGGGGIPPTPTGACCHLDGSCTVGTAAACSAAGGTYQGDGSPCTPNPCPEPDPEGACCYVDENCLFITQSACEASGGYFHGGPCEPSPCIVCSGPVSRCKCGQNGRYDTTTYYLRLTVESSGTFSATRETYEGPPDDCGDLIGTTTDVESLSSIFEQEALDHIDCVFVTTQNTETSSYHQDADPPPFPGWEPYHCDHTGDPSGTCWIELGTACGICAGLGYSEGITIDTNTVYQFSSSCDGHIDPADNGCSGCDDSGSHTYTETLSMEYTRDMLIDKVLAWLGPCPAGCSPAYGDVDSTGVCMRAWCTQDV